MGTFAFAGGVAFPLALALGAGDGPGAGAPAAPHPHASATTKQPRNRAFMRSSYRTQRAAPSSPRRLRDVDFWKIRA
jgi:hypothetical protein